MCTNQNKHKCKLQLRIYFETKAKEGGTVMMSH